MSSYVRYFFLFAASIYLCLMFFLDGFVNIKGLIGEGNIFHFLLNITNAVVCVFLVFSFGGVLEGYVRKCIKYYHAKKDLEPSSILVELISSTTYILKLVFALLISWRIIQPPERVQSYVNEFFSISILIVLLLFVTRFVNLVFTESLIEKSGMKTMSKALLPFVRRVIVVLIWIVGVITIVANLGYDVSALIAGAGVGGIAVALAAQKSVSNIFGAITILMNRPFNIGDYITINGITGTVKDIGLSYITLIDRAGHNVMIPNENFISSSIENESRRKYRRADFSIGLIYDTSLEQMENGVDLIEQILETEVEEKKLQSYRVNFEAFGDFSLNISVTYFSNTKNYTEFVKEKERINLEIKRIFTKAKLEMAFPTQEMIIKGGDLK